MRSIAWRRASSSRSVYSDTSPCRSDLNPALKFLAKPIERTTRPKAMPRFWRTSAPGRSCAVVIGSSKSAIGPERTASSLALGFEEDIALTPDGGGMIADGWATPRGPHGGYVMAILANAMERVAERQPRSITCHFLRPPQVGPVRVTTTVERAGRSMSTISARMEQEGKPVALALGAFSG